MRQQRLTRRRFRLNLPVTVSWTSVHQRRASAGMTVEIGSDGMLIAGVEEPPALGIVTASVDWPVRLGDGCPLRLIVVGRVLLAQRAVNTGVRIVADRFERCRALSVAKCSNAPVARNSIYPGPLQFGGR